MNLVVLILLGVGFAAGWYANERKSQIITWWNAKKQWFRNKVRDNT